MIILLGLFMFVFGFFAVLSLVKDTKDLNEDMLHNMRGSIEDEQFHK